MMEKSSVEAPPRYSSKEHEVRMWERELQCRLAAAVFTTAKTEKQLQVPPRMNGGTRRGVCIRSEVLLRPKTEILLPVTR